MNEPLFSVIIPIFNNWELTQNCLVSLKKQTKLPYEVIVVDNASSDKTVEFLAPFGESLFGNNFTRIRYEENRNYGPANNAGAKVARAPFLFFLNNDTIVTEGWEKPLVDELTTRTDVGGVGSLLLYEDDTIQHIGVAWSLLFNVYHIYSRFPKTHRVASNKRQVQTLTGAALMMPKSLFFEIGGFNEGFRNGFEDVNLSLRIINSGKKLYCLPDSVIYHLESMTPGRNKYEAENSILLRNTLKDLSLNVDEHVHALRDGFLPVLNDCFNFAITLCDEEEAELTARYETAPLDVLYDVFRKNFYWARGRSLLINIFEEKKEYEMASQLATYWAHTFPSEEAIKRACDLCLLANKKENIVSLQYALKDLLRFNSSSSLRKKELRRISAIGIRQNDSFLLKEVERTKKRMGL